MRAVDNPGGTRLIRENNQVIRKIGLAFTALALLAGCGSSGGKPNYSSNPASGSAAASSPSVSPLSSAAPSSAAPSSTAPSATGTATNAPPTEPQMAMQHDSDGALAFAAYFVRVLDWSIRNQNTSLLKEYGASSCNACQHYVTLIDRLNESGGHVEGGGLSLQQIALVTGSSIVKSDYIVQATILQQPDVIFSPGAAPSTELQTPTTNVSRFYIDWRPNGGWQIVEIGGS
jgi:hypothetical protein